MNNQEDTVRNSAPVKFSQQLDFVITLIKMLKKPVSVRFMMNELNVTDRTIYRWMEHLGELGFQVEKQEYFKYQITGGSNLMFDKALEILDCCYPTENKSNQFTLNNKTNHEWRSN